MVKEYKMILRPVFPADEEKRLNELSEEGWELVSVDTACFYMVKYKERCSRCGK